MTHIYSRKPHRNWFSAPEKRLSILCQQGLLIYDTSKPDFWTSTNSQYNGVCQWARASRLTIYHPNNTSLYSRKFFRRENGTIWWLTPTRYDPGSSPKLNKLRCLKGTK